MIRLVLVLLVPLPAGAIDLACSFDPECSATGACGPTRLEARYRVDPATQRASVVRGGAETRVAAAQGEAAISFAEYLASGGIEVTAGGAAVRSRHGVLDGALAPRQYCGTCTEGAP